MRERAGFTPLKVPLSVVTNLLWNIPSRDGWLV
jgi:hypothetical protein